MQVATSTATKDSDVFDSIDLSLDKLEVASDDSSPSVSDTRNTNLTVTSDCSETDISQMNSIAKRYQHPVHYKEILGYSIGKTLGQGSMGKVKLATHQETGETVAIKIIPRFPREWSQMKNGNPANIPYDPQRDSRIMREAGLLQLLDNDNIVKCLDLVVSKDYYYMIMEHVTGFQLLDLVYHNGRLTESESRSILKQLIAGVQYCHKNNIAHRDLKIENIIVDQPDVDQRYKHIINRYRKNDSGNRFKVKILDFGLSNFHEKHNLMSTSCGSLYFAAPELLEGKKYDGAKVDIWSLGVICYVLLCGKVPFDDESITDLHKKIKSGKVSYPSFLSQPAIHFLKRMLCVNPNIRANIDEIKNHAWLKGDDEIFVLSKLKQQDIFKENSFTGSENLDVTNQLFERQPIDETIVNILKRDPFVSLNVEENLLLTDSKGRPVSKETHHEHVRRNVHLNNPLKFGFALVGDKISTSNIKSSESATSSLYKLLFAFKRKLENKFKDNLDSIPELQECSESTLTPRLINQRSKKSHFKNSKSKMLLGTWTQVLPLIYCNKLYQLLIEEGFQPNFYDPSQNPFESKWSWRPSLTENNTRLIINKLVKFKIELLQVTTNTQYPGYQVYALETTLESGDHEHYEKVFERIKCRWNNLNVYKIV